MGAFELLLLQDLAVGDVVGSFVGDGGLAVGEVVVVGSFVGDGVAVAGQKAPLAGVTSATFIQPI